MVAIAGDGTLDPNVRVRRVNQLLDRGVPVRSARCCIAACLPALSLCCLRQRTGSGLCGASGGGAGDGRVVMRAVS
jgi:hypothetical protein